jgi:hypothetical protein
MSERMTAERLAKIKAKWEQIDGQDTEERIERAGYFAGESVDELLAEIERAWGEIEERRETTTRLSERVIEVGKERDVAVRRLAHAHDSASALYQAATLLLANAMQQAYGESDHYTVGAARIDALRATVDPALSAAALAECQRRDGLDEQIKQYEGRETQISNILATALIEVDIDPATNVVEMAQQAAGVMSDRRTLIAERDEARTDFERMRDLKESEVEAVLGRFAQQVGIVGPMPRPTLTAEQTSMRRAFDEARIDDGSPGGYLASEDGPPEMATTTGEDREMAGVGEATCNAKSPDKYICTLAPGHSGGHVAHTNPRNVVAEWPVSQ